MKCILIIYLTGLLFLSVNGQNVKDSTTPAILIQMEYSGNLPGGNFGDKFGYTSVIGGQLGYKTNNNWWVSGGGHFLFGDQTKDDSLLAMLPNASGQIIGEKGTPINLLIYQRGYLIQFNVKKITSLLAYNANSGITFGLGTGFMQYKYRFEVRGGDVPLLMDDYLKGFDQLTNGGFISEFIGYTFMGNKKRINFYVGFVFIQAVTKNRRNINYAIPSQEMTQNIDLLSGLKAGWIISIYRSSKNNTTFEF